MLGDTCDGRSRKVYESDEPIIPDLHTLQTTIHWANTLKSEYNKSIQERIL